MTLAVARHQPLAVRLEEEPHLGDRGRVSEEQGVRGDCFVSGTGGPPTYR